MIPTLIFCAGSNKRFVEIALKYGYKYGARLPSTLHGQVYFADQNYHKPDRKAYMQALANAHPAIATVLDHEPHVPLCEVLDWAEEAAQWVQEAIIVIPKVHRVEYPRAIGGKAIWKGYSVATTYGGTAVGIEEFRGWPVHLLGGSPQRQMRMAAYLNNVQSADGNYYMLQAQSNQFFVPGCAIAANRYFPQLQEAGLGHYGQDAIYRAFEMSCMNIRAAWQGCYCGLRFAHAGDLPAIKEIAKTYSSELGFVMLPALRESIERNTLIVAFYRHEITGFVNYRACKDGWQTIYEIAVRPDWRGRNVGKGLLCAVPTPIRLKCTVDNPANEFYRKAGFELASVEVGRKRQLNVWKKQF